MDLNSGGHWDNRASSGLFLGYITLPFTSTPSLVSPTQARTQDKYPWAPDSGLGLVGPPLSQWAGCITPPLSPGQISSWWHSLGLTLLSPQILGTALGKKQLPQTGKNTSTAWYPSCHIRHTQQMFKWSPTWFIHSFSNQPISQSQGNSLGFNPAPKGQSNWLQVLLCYAKSLQSYLTLCDPGRLWIVAHQAPLSMEFSTQEYWSGLPCPPPGDLPNSGIKPASLTYPALAGRFFTTSTIWETQNYFIYIYIYLFRYWLIKFSLITTNLKVTWQWLEWNKPSTFTIQTKYTG